MREKAQTLISMIAAPFDDYVRGIAEKLRGDLRDAPGGLTPEREQAVVDFERNLHAGQNARTDTLVEAVGKLLSEEEIDALVAHFKTPLAQKQAQLGQVLLDADNANLNAVIAATPSMKSMLDDLAKAFMVANTDGAVAESIASNPVGCDAPLPEAPPPPEAA